jgi:enoyl-[acyl-carrier protein] reductase I
MEAAGGGAILTMTYLGGERAVPHYNVMGVAKATLDSSVRYLAWDLGQKNIRVNAVSAGPVRTLAARSIAGFPTMEAIVEERSPLHRPIDADDVGPRRRTCSRTTASNVTATTLYVDSGVPRDGDVTEFVVRNGRWLRASVSVKLASGRKPALARDSVAATD